MNKLTPTQSSLSVTDEATSKAKARSAWDRPTLTRIEMKLTLNGGGSISDGIRTSGTLNNRKT